MNQPPLWPAALVLGLPTITAAAPAPALMSAQALLPEQSIDTPAYFVSEKLDGVRARWDGQQLLTRSGASIEAPTWFVQGLPPVALDGELWLGRGRFDETSALIRSSDSENPKWRQIGFYLFDLPNHPGTFARRQEGLRRLITPLDNPRIKVIEQQRGMSRTALDTLLDRLQRNGGEGLMLHHASARYTHNRSELLLKYKGYQDAEARVVGHTDGKGKYAGMTGALIVETEGGVRFRIGSGLSDAERADPPAIGATITYRYNGLTGQGKPRFARFMRVHDSAL